MKRSVLLLTVLVVILTALPKSRAGESPAQRDTRMAWWREARFGMFVHWGLYSGLAGTWDGKAVGNKGGMEWIQQRVKADTDTYAQRALPLFKPGPGFARDWARLAKTAGCRYLVFTTKHHDGFALHDSQTSDYDAGSKLHRDLVREIVDAARAEGLRVGFYHSVIDWHHDQYCYEKSKQLPHPLKGRPYPNGTRDHAQYLDYLHAEVNELVSNYGPVDILWWDYSAQDFQGDEAWRATALMQLVRSKQPAVIMNNRLYRSPEAGWTSMGTEGYAPQLDPKYGDFITPEQHIPATGMPGVDWETCMTLNTTWGYSDHDHAWKSDETLIRNLIDIASKGGNYLLNIGPKGDGSVPSESIQSMEAIGAWMKVNGAAIYGTTASPFTNLDWGRCTRKGTTLYLHVFTWPGDGTLLVPLRNQASGARLLADPSHPLAVSASSDGVRIRLPARAPDAIATVLALEITGEPHVIAGSSSKTPEPARASVSDRNGRAAFEVPRLWEYSAPLIAPEKRDSNPSRAQKDPTVVFYGGKWHVFMTVKLQGRSAIEYCSFEKWDQADRSARTILPISRSDYYCAAQVFYFTPHKKWYLVYQMGVPGADKMWVAYSTTADIADPNSWTQAAPILDGGKNDPRREGGLDYWIICDSARAYLFLTNLNGKMWRLWTRLEDFPRGFGHCELALEAKIFEASHTYKLKGMDKYLTIIEENGRRYYKAYLADRLDGAWTPVADTAERPFAGWKNIRPAPGVQPWTDNISHGELLRDGYDETLTVDPGHLRFLFQGMWDKDKAGTGYGQFQWRLGILTPVAAAPAPD